MVARRSTRLTDFKYKAFISYAHSDEKWAKWLHRGLETYRVPRHIVSDLGLESNRLIPVFRDRDELASSADLSAVIEQALSDSESLIVICSPEASQSRWVNEEIKLFKQLGKGDRVFCLLVGDPAESFPPAALVDVDGNGIATAEETEPLAADARPGSDGEQAAKLKLIAGLLGTGLDQLTRRETQRKHRRMLLITVASLVAMVFAISLSVFALISRNEANRQRLVAVREAAMATQVTNFLVDLFKSSDPYAEAGGDVSAADVLDRGAERMRYESLPDPIVEARLLATIGEAYSQLGIHDEARQHLDRALRIQRRILEPGDLQLLNTQISRAWLAVSTDDFQEAQEIYASLLPVLDEGEDFLRVLPGGSEWARLLNDFGVLQYSLDNYEYAAEILEQALRLAETEFGPSHEEVATTISNLALTYQYQGELDEAKRLYERSLAISEKFRGRDHPSLLVTLNNLASSERFLGQLESARVYLERAIRIAEDNFEPNHPAIALTANQLGILSFKLGDYDIALEQLERAGAICMAVFGLEHTLTAANLQHQARLHKAVGNPDLAQPLLERSVQAYTAVSGADTPNIAGVYVDLAQVHDGLGNIDEANALYSRAAEILSEKLPPDHTATIRINEEYALFLERTGLSRP
jgi:tetratricopeptide (TPR) repeat protein